MVRKQQEPEVVIDQRNVHQVNTPDGTPYKGYVTDCIWVNRSDPYQKLDGNEVTPLLTGEKYFAELADAIAGAKKTVYMLGWQINWDVMLKPGLRLYDAILKAIKANANLKVYILPWKQHDPINTFCYQTVNVLNAINNKTFPRKQIFAQVAEQHSDPSDGWAVFFSHHQKQVVIDSDATDGRAIAFVGGIDVCYGRLDNEKYLLNAAGRLGNDAYNGCVKHFKKIDEKDFVDGLNLDKVTQSVSEKNKQVTDSVWEEEKLDQPGMVELPLDSDNKETMLDPKTQPRMPWQDVHLKINGPVVSDLGSNFVMRWNMAVDNPFVTPLLRLPPLPSSYPKPGSCSVQFLRSASDTMVELEFEKTNAGDQSRVHNIYAHNHIHHAYLRLIEHADHFIYIENQFFVSDYGQERFGDNVSEANMSLEIKFARSATKAVGTRYLPDVGDGNAKPRNKICEALGEKLRAVIMDQGNDPPDGTTSPFHIYITLPVHSEGMLNDATCATQVHYTMQTLVFGTQSLLNRIRRAIKARLLYENDKNDKTYHRVFLDNNFEYESIPIEQCWPYVTLLNLRNWDKLGAKSGYVTEQIYIHTKMMVVDDRYAIVGSANINDRSLLGDRDSEMAVLVMDTDFKYEDIGAKEGPTVTRTFAGDLRKGVWNKIFGITGDVRPAKNLAEAVNKPAAPASWKAIRQQAEDNTKLYEAVFPWIPRNGAIDKNGKLIPASIWPTSKVIEHTFGNERDGGLMPFDKAFWDKPQHTAATSQLDQVKGYITLLPWLWTKGQNNNSYMHSALFVENDVKQPDNEETEEAG